MKLVIKTINSQKFFNILLNFLFIVIVLAIINTAISIILFFMRMLNQFIQNLNWTIIFVGFIIFVFLLFFFPKFYRNPKNVKFKFISRFHLKMTELTKKQITKDFLLGSLFIFIEILLSLFIIFRWIRPEDFELLSFIIYSYTLSVVIFDITVIGIIYNKNIIKFFSFHVIYSSVLVGVLFPMLFISGIFFILFYFYFISWIFADPTFLLKSFTSSWLNTSLSIRFNYDLFFIIKMIIFLFGLILFLISLGQLVHGLKKKKGLVQTGIYKYFRHPQNLAMIIMAFPLFIPHGIRMGDLISWVQFACIIIISSDIGDIKLKKKYPEQFQQHYEKTGFMFPKLFSHKLLWNISVFENKKARYGLFFLLYIVIIIFFYLIHLILPFERLWI